MSEPTNSTRLIECLRAALADRYAPEREIGRGGMSTVFLAKDLRHGREVAIKLLHAELAAMLGTERFEREIRTIAGLQHPHILPLYDSGAACGSLYYVMPYVGGESLRQRLRRETQLSLDETLQITREIAGALDFAHRHGVVHRDIKPENILLEDGHAVLTDFGIARAVHDAADVRLTADGLVVGTPSYMSPEQAGGAGPVDGRSDLYSLACVAYEMLCGEPPFTGPTAQSVIARQLADPPPPLLTVRRNVPLQVSLAIERALEKVPADRFETMTQFTRAFSEPPPAGAIHGGPRTRRLFAGAAILAALVATTLLLQRARPSPPTRVSPTVVAVLPFVVRGGSGVTYLREGMVDLLSTNLDGAGALRSVDPQTLLRGVDGNDSSLTDPARARVIAERLGAGMFVIGSVLEAGGRLRINASLYHSAHGRSALAQSSVEGRPEEIFSLVDQLATALVVRQQDAQLSRIDSLTTRSFPALKAYLEGTTVFRAGRYPDAVVVLQRAIASDPTFALAYYRLALAAEWDAQYELAASVMREGTRHRSRLSERDRRLFDALLAWQSGRIEMAEREYRAIVAAYPDEAEAWLQLGEALFHYNPQRGRSVGEAREVFERALLLFPNRSDVVTHLLDVALIEGRQQRFDSLYARLDPSTDPAMRRRVMRAFAWGGAGEREAAVAELRAARDGSVVFTAGAVAAYVPDLVGGLRLARLMTEPSRTAAVRAGGYALVAHIATGAGRLREARAALTRLAVLAPANALEHSAFLAVARGFPHPPEELTHLRAELTALDAGAVPPVTSQLSWLTVHDDAHVPLREYLRGMLSARLGDSVASERALASLVAMRVSGDVAALLAGLRSGLRAEVEYGRARPGEALRALAAADTLTPSVAAVASSPFFAHTAERYLRAELLTELGRDEDALAWFASLTQSRQDVAYLALSHLRRAEIRARRGDTADAIAHYRRFVALWRGSDPELQPIVDEARARLVLLGDGGVASP